MSTEINLNILNNEQMVQHIKRLQATLEQYNARDEASQGVARIRDKPTKEMHQTRGEVARAYCKGKGKVDDEESSDEASRSVD